LGFSDPTDKVYFGKYSASDVQALTFEPFAKDNW